MMTKDSVELEKGMGDGVPTRPDFPDASKYEIAGAQPYPVTNFS